ncbi:hypothetical protein EDB86DRAFT_2837859 [Lactarius hatsudake]|nr:hypothetical protein EDB86DRAFT_2837859 [Lactarius hatsudake]
MTKAAPGQEKPSAQKPSPGLGKASQALTGLTSALGSRGTALELENAPRLWLERPRQPIPTAAHRGEPHVFEEVCLVKLRGGTKKYARPETDASCVAFAGPILGIWITLSHPRGIAIGQVERLIHAPWKPKLIATEVRSDPMRGEFGNIRGYGGRLRETSVVPVILLPLVVPEGAAPSRDGTPGRLVPGGKDDRGSGDCASVVKHHGLPVVSVFVDLCGRTMVIFPAFASE